MFSPRLMTLLNCLRQEQGGMTFTLAEFVVGVVHFLFVLFVASLVAAILAEVGIQQATGPGGLVLIVVVLYVGSLVGAGVLIGRNNEAEMRTAHLLGTVRVAAKYEIEQFSGPDPVRFHRLTCGRLPRWEGHELVYFPSREKAGHAGFIPCRACRSDLSEHEYLRINDPCPCGSGNKYENCCGRLGWLSLSAGDGSGQGD